MQVRGVDHLQQCSIRLHHAARVHEHLCHVAIEGGWDRDAPRNGGRSQRFGIDADERQLLGNGLLTNPADLLVAFGLLQQAAGGHLVGSKGLLPGKFFRCIGQLGGDGQVLLLELHKRRIFQHHEWSPFPNRAAR